MIGLKATVRGTAQNFEGNLIDAFDQYDVAEGLGFIMGQIPEVRHGVCKSLCMNWVAHHANEVPGRFSDVARSMGSGNRRNGGYYTGVGMALDQMDYAAALMATPNRTEYNRTKDQFTDDFLRKRGVVRQMKISNPALNLSPSRIKMGAPGRAVNIAFGRQIAAGIVGDHTAGNWSYKIISIHGSAGGHAIAAFVGADAVFFDPNYGIFYFEKSANFQRWFGEPGGFYWKTRYHRYLGNDFSIKSYAKGI
jgi:hypothetical protein